MVSSGTKEDEVSQGLRCTRDWAGPTTKTVADYIVAEIRSKTFLEGLARALARALVAAARGSVEKLEQRLRYRVFRVRCESAYPAHELRCSKE